MTDELIIGSDTQVDAAFYMRAANAAVRRECGWHVAPVISETLTLDGPGGVNLLVPSLRVKQILSVKNDGVEVKDRVRFSRRTGVLSLASGWSCELGGIELELQHGFELDEVAEVAALIVTLTKRAASGGNPWASQSVGSASATAARGRDGAPIGVPLLETEKELLAPYRLTWGA